MTVGVTSTHEDGHLLMLVHRIPYPPDKGDKIRSYNEFKFLRENGWKLHLCTFVDDEEDLSHVERLKSQCVTFSGHRIRKCDQYIAMFMALLKGQSLSVRAFYKKDALRYVRKTMAEFPIKALLCFSSPMAEYFFKAGIFPQKGRPRSVMDLIDVDSNKWEQYAKTSSLLRRWIYLMEASRLSAYERRIVSSFDATLVVSETEADFLRKRTGFGEKIHGIANGVDTDYFHPISGSDQPNKKDSVCSLVFCGLMDYHPNVDGVKWFANEVLPLVKDKIGDVEFHVVGARPTKEIQSLNSIDGITVHGRVEDVRPYVGSASISVAPIRIARGIQNKVLEAMAMGKPVVATQQAFEGIEAVPGRDLVVTKSDPREFAGGIEALWHNNKFLHEASMNARKLAINKYSWKSRLNMLNSLLKTTNSNFL